MSHEAVVLHSSSVPNTGSLIRLQDNEEMLLISCWSPARIHGHLFPDKVFSNQEGASSFPSNVSNCGKIYIT